LESGFLHLDQVEVWSEHSEPLEEHQLAQSANLSAVTNEGGHHAAAAAPGPPLDDASL
jgi:hypothetical protein